MPCRKRRGIFLNRIKIKPNQNQNQNECGAAIKIKPNQNQNLLMILKSGMNVLPQAAGRSGNSFLLPRKPFPMRRKGFPGDWTPGGSRPARRWAAGIV
jgi:hypothetical protein